MVDNFKILFAKIKVINYIVYEYKVKENEKVQLCTERNKLIGKNVLRVVDLCSRNMIHL